MESMLGKFDSYYKDWPKGKVGQFGCSTTYLLGYEWLKECSLIEDWGCGRGLFQSLCRPGQCRNLDCSCTPWADEQVELVTYKSKVPGIMMRGVLEHNYEWEKVLSNALSSFTERMALILFTPFGEKQKDLWPDPTGIPCLSLVKDQLLEVLRKGSVKWNLVENIETQTMFKMEHIFYIWK